tara:strand:+ start:47 stop:277 length:231 start_codon:yes stop_codon:yes gene_type:complete
MYIIPFSRLKKCGNKAGKKREKKTIVRVIKESRNKAGIKKGSEPESPNPEPESPKSRFTIIHDLAMSIYLALMMPD